MTTLKDFMDAQPTRNVDNAINTTRQPDGPDIYDNDQHFRTEQKSKIKIHDINSDSEQDQNDPIMASI